MAVCLRTLQCSQSVNAAAFSPDGQWLATGGNDRCITICRASGPAAGDLLHTFYAGATVMCVAFCPSGDDDRVAAGLFDGAIKVWSASAGTCLLTLAGHDGLVYSVAFSPRDGGRTLASASYDMTVRIWQTVDTTAGPAAGACLHILRDHTLWVLSVAYSPDGSRLVTGSSDQTLTVWSAINSTAGACLAAYDVGGICCSVAFLPCARVIAVVSLRDVRLLNASTGAVLNVLRGHTGAIRSLAVVPSGRLLAAGSTDSTIKLWCIKGLGAGTSPATLKEHGDNIQSVAVSPSGCMLATASKDCTAKLWDITALLPEARVLALVLIGRRRRGELPHVPQELWKLTLDDFY